MAADIIWYIIMFACAALFVGIGVYARNRKEPMWFWSGSEVDAAAITDVTAYNRENAKMWLWYPCGTGSRGLHGYGAIRWL